MADQSIALRRMAQLAWVSIACAASVADVVYTLLVKMQKLIKHLYQEKALGSTT
jgi:ribosomal protein L37AE/L43A